jgi:SAM-dependent methyltransferase
VLGDLELSAVEAEYLRLHRPRFEHLIAGMEALVVDGRGRGEPRILDVGPSFQTVAFRERWPEATVDTIGFANRLTAARDGERHLDWDLTEAPWRERWPELGDDYDFVVIAEVIEHLATSPLAVFRWAATCLAAGGRLVVQTPNALALHKRLRVLAGRDPLGAGSGLTGGSHNQGHFREYTRAELATLGEAAGLELESVSIRNYFRHPGAGARLYDRLTAMLPAGTRQGITVYLRRRGPSASR